MKFVVQDFQVGKRRERNRYPLNKLNKVGRGFIVPKEQVPKGSLHNIGRHLGYRVSVETLPDGSKKVVRVA